MSPPKDVVSPTEEYFAEQDKGTLKDEQVRISKAEKLGWIPASSESLSNFKKGFYHIKRKDLLEKKLASLDKKINKYESFADFVKQGMIFQLIDEKEFTFNNKYGTPIKKDTIWVVLGTPIRKSEDFLELLTANGPGKRVIRSFRECKMVPSTRIQSWLLRNQNDYLVSFYSNAVSIAEEHELVFSDYQNKKKLRARHLQTC